MSQPTGTDHAPASGGGGDVIDLYAYMSPEALDHAERAARERVRASAAGLSDLTTGTVDLSKDVPPADLTEDGGVLEQPHGDAPAGGTDLRPVIPETFLDPAAWRHRYAVAKNRAAFHAVRTPLYAARTARVVALGAWVGARDFWSYVWLTEYGRMTDKVHRTRAGDEYIAELRDERAVKGAKRRREPAVVYGTAAFNSYIAALLALGQAWSLVLVVPALLPLVGVLYALGRRELARRAALTGVPYAVLDDPDAGVIEAGATVLTDSMLNGVFRTAEVLKEGQEMTLTRPIRAAEINGVEAGLRLPDKVTVSKVLARIEYIAAALDIPEDWLDIRQDGSPGRLSFWMTDTDPFAEHRPSPLLKLDGPIDAVRDGIPASFDKRGQDVMLRLYELMMLVGGATRAGKGLVLRNLVCGAALDPRVRIRIATGKKPAEHSVYAPVLATYMHQHGERLLMTLDLLEQDIERRSRKLARKGRSTPSDEDLAEDGIELLIIDEAADYLDTNTPDKYKKELAEKLTVKLDAIARAGAGVGVFLVIAVQDPKKGMIDTRLMANLLERWALRCADADAANAILGSGSVGRGMRPQDILRAQAPLGIRKGAEGERLTRAYMIDQNEHGEAARIIAKAAELRGRLGALPGQRPDPIEDALATATGQTTVCGGLDGLGDPAPVGTVTGGGAGGGSGVLAAMLAVFDAAADPATGKLPERLPTAAILAGLAQQDPAAWSPAALKVDPDDQERYVQAGGAELRRRINAELSGTGQTLIVKGWSAGGRANGYYLADIQAAAGIAPV